MTETEEVTELDVDLNSEIPCYPGTTGIPGCQNSAAWRITSGKSKPPWWRGGSSKTLFKCDHCLLLWRIANPTGHPFDATITRLRSSK